MKHGTFFQRLAMGLAAFGLCMPQIAAAATPDNRVPVITDIKLQQGNSLVGQVVTSGSATVAGVDVALHGKGRQLAVSKTDANGRFAFAGLNTGVYEVTVPDGRKVYRVWTADTAPPAAKPVALIVSRTDIIRGQHGMRTIRNLLANPCFVAAGIAAAIAIPVALHNVKKSPSSP